MLCPPLLFRRARYILIPNRRPCPAGERRSEGTMKPNHPPPADYFPVHRALMTDLYQLTMAAGYHAQGLNRQATFELFVRRITPRRNYLVCAGLAQALAYLEDLHFEEDEIRYLRAHPSFRHVSADFYDYLRAFRFHGEVWAAPEGSLIFSDEPFVQVTAPLIEAQIVETYLLSMVNFQTMIATKAARVVQAARTRQVIDFGTRRAQGPEAGMLAARACFVGGCAGTSNVAAGLTMGIPTFGTIAHSWVMAFDNEAESFRRYAEVFPDSSTLLIDTYDLAGGAEAAARLKEACRGVRIDSGDLYEGSRRVRAILDGHGLRSARIVASSDLNEFIIEDLLRRGAPIDSFGVGTEMVVSADAPSIGGVYKLVELTEADGRVRPVAKFSAGKATRPGRKQIWRLLEDGEFRRDILGLREESAPDGFSGVLIPVMAGGRRLSPPESLPAIQERTLENLRRLPAAYRDIHRAVEFPVAESPALVKLGCHVRADHPAPQPGRP
jgi:nicotinate phosphoribosyltransferase